MKYFKSLIGATILVCVFGCDPVSPNDFTGANAPDFEVSSVKDNSKVSLADYRKDKVVVLDFWATWCGPCRVLSPYIEAICDKYRDKGVVGMAISNEKAGAVAAFEKKTPHKIPVFVDSESVATLSYRVGGLPTIFVIGKDGRVIYQTTGFPQTGPASTVKEIEDAVIKGTG